MMSAERILLQILLQGVYGDDEDEEWTLGVDRSEGTLAMETANSDQSS
jgi:hypothetical protein